LATDKCQGKQLKVNGIEKLPKRDACKWVGLGHTLRQQMASGHGGNPKKYTGKNKKRPKTAMVKRTWKVLVKPLVQATRQGKTP